MSDSGDGRTLTTAEMLERYGVEGYEFTMTVLGVERTVNISPADADVMDQFEAIINAGAKALGLRKDAKP